MPSRNDKVIEFLANNDAPGALAHLKSTMKKPNPHSLSDNIATVKNLFYQRNGQPRGYDEAVGQLQRAVEQSSYPTETARKFLALNPTDRRAMIRVNTRRRRRGRRRRGGERCGVAPFIGVLSTQRARGRKHNLVSPCLYYFLR